MAIRDAVKGARADSLHTVVSTGVVRSVREDYNDPDKVQVEVKLPKVKVKKPGPKTMANAVESYQPSQDVRVPKSMGITVGDKVSISTTIERSV